ncbi:MAG: site-specific integrase, partial [Ilumatobacteraceae bacterium]
MPRRDFDDVVDGILPLEVEEFLVWLAAERGRSPNTLASYRRDLRQYQAWCSERGADVLTIGLDDLRQFVAERKASGLAPASVARQLAAIRMLHRYLASERHRSDDPTARLDGVKVPAGLPKPLAEDEVVSLLDAVVGDDPVA